MPFILDVIMLNFIMLSIVMLNVMTPKMLQRLFLGIFSRISLNIIMAGSYERGYFSLASGITFVNNLVEHLYYIVAI